MAGWWASFPELSSQEDPAMQEVLESGRRVTAERGDMVFLRGDPANNYLLALEGRVRVQALTESGREVVLYRVEPGQSCVLTTSCLLARDPYPAEAVAETRVEAIAIPAENFRRGLASSPAFRDFVFSYYGKRLGDLITLVQAITSRRVESRLATHLLEHEEAQDLVRTTHQELAAELGTAREVISRQLKAMERNGLVKLQRGGIEVIDRQGLRHLSDQGAM